MDSKRILKVHPSDNVWVALEDLPAGAFIQQGAFNISVKDNIPCKHKFAETELQEGEEIRMYGVRVGRAKKTIQKGALLSQSNVSHAASPYEITPQGGEWTPPNVSGFAGKTFDGYLRADGKAGTRNYWLVFPLVFCENRNIKVIEETMLEALGYASEKHFSVDIEALITAYKDGANTAKLLDLDILKEAPEINTKRVFENVDGIKFLTHQSGCGGTREDAELLCKLLAGYVAHPNVAGATVLSLGCQNAQYKVFQDALKQQDSKFTKPLYFLEQQQSASERAFIADAVKRTFIGLTMANKQRRRPISLSKLVLGLECGGSDGFSGISANPALGHASDLLVALGGTTILSEFPELNGVEQELINRCVDQRTAEKFAALMQAYSASAEAVGSGFDMNPSPGNIKDGLITDAMKSAGAAKKGGTSPVQDVLDYAELAKKPGLNLLCTPGNDVESTTGLAGSGANLIVFTTGLGTPTGNPVAPTIKFSSNSALATRMADIIDIDAGAIVAGRTTIESMGEKLLDYLIEVASGRQLTKAEKLGQDDFIPWKRGVSL